MATRARIGLKQADGTIITAYQHWDGYPGGLGYENDGYYDSRIFELIGFNFKTITKRNLGKHDTIFSYFSNDDKAPDQLTNRVSNDRRRSPTISYLTILSYSHHEL